MIAIMRSFDEWMHCCVLFLVAGLFANAFDMMCIDIVGIYLIVEYNVVCLIV